MKKLLSLCLVLSAGGCLLNAASEPEIASYPDPERYAKAIGTFEEWDSKNSFPADAVLFVGSSSIRMWPTAEAFGDAFPVINRGFGGSIVADSVYFCDRIILKYKPRVVVVYAGTNDINRKLPPAMVHADFVRLVEMIHAALPGTEIVYLSSTPNRSRWHWQEQMQAYDTLNKAFAAKHKFITFMDMVDLFLGEDGLPNPAFFIDDQLHFNSTGYAVWNQTLAPILREKYRLAMSKSSRTEK